MSRRVLSLMVGLALLGSATGAYAQGTEQMTPDTPEPMMQSDQQMMTPDTPEPMMQSDQQMMISDTSDSMMQPDH